MNKYFLPPLEFAVLDNHNDTIMVSKSILLEDLSRHLNKLCVLDLKMGTRQYNADANPYKTTATETKISKDGIT